VWKWLSEVLKQLGHDGMSSDDSEIEDDMDVILRVKRLPWRRDISKELEYIDSQRILETNPFSRKGARPMKRRRGEGVSTRAAMEGLPAIFYDQQWLREQCLAELELKVSNAAFQWLTLVFGQDDDGNLGDEE
jgi:hypothetical protein